MHRQMRRGKKKRKQQRVRERTGQGGAPGTRAEIALQLTGKLHWSRYFPVAHEGPQWSRPTWKPMEDPILKWIISELQSVARTHTGAVHERLQPSKGPTLKQGNCEEKTLAEKS